MSQSDDRDDRDDRDDSREGRREASRSGGDFTLRDPDPGHAGGLPRIDFSTFVLSLGASGMVHLGLLPEAEGAAAGEPNLPLAQQTIDTLQMLLEKTQGNLDEDEAKLIQSVLYELRMGFVKVRG